MRRQRHTLPIALAVCALVVAFASIAFILAWSRYETSLPPLDLAASREGSALVIDRDGRLLRAFTLRDGRWRLPATTHDVDPRYVAMLVGLRGRALLGSIAASTAALGCARRPVALTRGHVVSGGSTLTMQVARLLEPRAERTVAAKLIQIARALRSSGRSARPRSSTAT